MSVEVLLELCRPYRANLGNASISETELAAQPMSAIKDTTSKGPHARVELSRVE